MTDWPSPTRADHQRFCKIEGWRQVRDSRGRTGTHHITVEHDLPDGRTLRTRVSHPPDRTGYGRSLWAHILRDQLQVTEAEFWSCVSKGAPPARAMHLVDAVVLPADIVHQLIHRVGLSENEVATMRKQDAIARMVEYWSSEAGSAGLTPAANETTDPPDA